MFQDFWSYALMLALSIAPVVFLAKVLWASHTMAASADIRRIVTYLLGFAVTAVASVMILAWAFKAGLPLVADLFTNNPATAAINDAGLQLTGALDTAIAGGGFSLPGGGGDSSPSLPGLPGLPGDGGSTFPAPNGQTAPPAEAAPETIPTVAPTPVRSIVLTIDTSHDWAGYTVRPGDSMGSIARRYGVSLVDLCAMNVGVTQGNCNFIRPGMQVKLPVTNGQAPRERVQVAKPVYQTVNNTQAVVQPTVVPPVQKTVEAGGQTYIIQPGDTIYTIAGKFGGMGKVYTICTANRATLGDNCDNLQAGATIVIK